MSKPDPLDDVCPICGEVIDTGEATVIIDGDTIHARCIDDDRINDG